MGFSMEKTNYCDEKAVHKCVKIGGLVLSVPRDRLAVGDEWTEVSSKKEVTRSLEWIDVETRIKYRVLSEGAFCVLGKSIPIFTIQGTYSDGKSMQYLYSTSLGVVAIFFPENVDDDVPRFFVLVDEKGLLWEE
ncbi:hypothetical protein N789_14785 [Arenimonas oryziterrae DSM 21050 = YC6267]|uniref:Uncharacterized protein n=2 Tax=Arenimonas TaxID=490567 RepID=A0A091AQV4_9GAMM|nr:hypothetical protein N789_14785 [Arenimonas oryziterrae DSM 21050 = YC6267]